MQIIQPKNVTNVMRSLRTCAKLIHIKEDLSVNQMGATQSAFSAPFRIRFKVDKSSWKIFLKKVLSMKTLNI